MDIWGTPTGPKFFHKNGDRPSRRESVTFMAAISCFFQFEDDEDDEDGAPITWNIHQSKRRRSSDNLECFTRKNKARQRWCCCGFERLMKKMKITC